MKLTACDFRVGAQPLAQVATCAHSVNPQSLLLCELKN